MKLFKKFLCTLMIIVILTLSVGSSYFDARHMTKVNAAVLEISAGLVFEICLLVGAAYITVIGAGQLMEHKEDIARVGKNFIDSIPAENIPRGWAFKFTNEEGQTVVVGSEVINYIQSCVWAGILQQVTGGGDEDPDDDDDDDDDDDNGFNISKFFSPKAQLVGSFTALTATWFVDSAKKLYQKFVNGEELTEAEAAVFEPILSGHVTDMNIAAQWSGEPFMYTAYSDYSYEYTVSKNVTRYTYDYSVSAVYPVAAYLNTTGADYHYINFLCNGTPSGYPSFDRLCNRYSNGELVNTSTTTNAAQIPFERVTNDFVTLSSFYYVNFPLFATESAARAYLDTGDATGALNYAHVYQNADWLSDDWAGQLVDPLTDIGLTLSQLLDLMKQLGLNAVGNNLSPEELLDMIREALPAVNPDLLPGHVNDPVIEPDPDKPPIYYPSPDAWPEPDPDPGTKPDPDPGTDPDDPSGNPDIDRPNGTWVVDLSRYFPFCIPFDLIHLLNALDADPQAPRFEFPLKIPAYGVDYTFVIDLSMFNTVAVIFRTFETLLFILGLILLTRHLIRG